MKKILTLLLALLFVLSTGCAFLIHDRGHGKKKGWKKGRTYNQMEHKEKNDDRKH